MPLARTAEFVDSRDLPPMDVIFGRSPMMAAARGKLERVAETTVPVLLQGESGTGKESFRQVAACAIQSFKLCLGQSDLPGDPLFLIESELFGYEKGAFTGAYSTKRGRMELAHLGTMFLDEVGSLDSSIQAKLLQVLQDGTFTRVGAQESRRVDARLVCAAKENLRHQAEDGNFRLDFFFRINAVTIDLPPLRQRSEDLPVLIDYFLNLYSKAYRLDPKPLSREITSMMQRYSWPGNIRQLGEHDSQLCSDRRRRVPNSGSDAGHLRPESSPKLIWPIPSR
jgi:two-component system, NtrC family, response regulator AtoC